MDFDTLQWFEAQKHPDALPLYEALEERILAEIPGVRIKVQKSQISFYTKHLFGCVSYLRARKKAQLPPCYLVVTVGLARRLESPRVDLARRLESPRVDIATEPYPGRWTHHIVVGSAGEINGELMDWIKEAAAFANQK